MFVPDLIRRCVAFLGIERQDGSFLPRATAFFAHAGENDFLRTHIVTAEHVVTHINERIAAEERKTGEKHRMVVRLNVRTGSSQLVPLSDAHWWTHPDENNPSDVAVTPYSFHQPAFDQFPLPLYGTLVDTSTKKHLRAKGAALGQEIAIVGLFRHHRGSERNEPIVRVGNIAAMPEEPVRTEYCGYTEGFLVEARSIAGLSGSPVFVNLTDSASRLGQMKSDDVVDFSRYMLLGLMHGHWDLPNLVDDAVVDDKKDAIRADSDHVEA